MIQSCVTISLVEQARGGPFVYWDDLASGCQQAAELGFDAVEIFAPSPDAVNPSQLRELLDTHQLRLAAVGTGAGWVIQGLSLTAADAGVRQQAQSFVRSIIDFGGPFGAMTIIGSMQGSWSSEVDRETALGYLSEALHQLGDYAKNYHVPLIYEPLNRYETNLVNTIADGVTLLQSLSTDNVRLLADLFHMNIEEVDPAVAIREGGDMIGHVHFVDSNRQAAGRGHLNYEPIVTSLREIQYDGYLSAEALAVPDSDAAARQTIQAFREHFA
ncbi:MAG: sugar phosphate isomerase/epimerase [Pirellulaceae bacterium]|nr:sugar phosphate isomerase/epimerase [Pirellulaceae bacterium]